MSSDGGAAPLVTDQKEQVIATLHDTALLLSRAGANLERLALSIGTIDFSASDVDQIKQYSAVIAASKDLHGTLLADKEKKKRKRAERDPDAPKKPMSSYMYYQEEKRDDFQKKNPELPYRDLMKLIGNSWKAMTDAQKAPYVKLQHDAQEQHVVTKAAYEKGKSVPPPDKSHKKEVNGAKDKKATKEAKAEKTKPAKPTSPVVSKKSAPPKAPESSSEEESDGDEIIVKKSVAPSSKASRKVESSTESESGEETDDSEEDEEPVQPPKKKSKVEDKSVKTKKK